MHGLLVIYLQDDNKIIRISYTLIVGLNLFILKSGLFFFPLGYYFWITFLWIDNFKIDHPDDNLWLIIVQVMLINNPYWNHWT
jgi:hypothetical protein